MDLYGDLDKYENANISGGASKEGNSTVAKDDSGATVVTKIKMAFKPRTAVNKSLPVTSSFKPRATVTAATPSATTTAKAVSSVPTTNSNPVLTAAAVATEENTETTTALPHDSPPPVAPMPPSSSSTFSFAGATTTQTITKTERSNVEAPDHDLKTVGNEDEIHRSRQKFFTVIDDGVSWDVEDPYDPLKPNDYMKILEERKSRKRQKALAKDNERHIRELDRERKEFQREKEDAIKQGDLEKVAAITAARGGGRGRGLSNLPAWMTAGTDKGGSNLGTKAEQGDDGNVVQGQFENSSSLSGEGVERKRSRFIDPSCVMLLENMVTKKDVDDSLTVETAEECARYGAVKKCLTYEMNDESIRLFVLFENQAGCIKACKDMDQRFFAGRQVKATFYNEENFSRGELDR